MPAAKSDAHDEYMTTAQVSQALSVSVTTVKRWVDDGILPAHRTAGGHRKLLRADVQRAVRDGNLPVDASRLHVPDGPPGDNLPQQFLSAVTQCDVDAIPEILAGAYRRGLTIEAIADAIVSPAMVHLGELWATGRVEVLHEHRVSQACQSGLFALKATLRGRSGSGPIALGGAPENDYSILPNLFVELALADCGWRTMNLGPHTPFATLQAAVAEFSPRLVWLSVTHVDNVEVFHREYAEFFAAAKAKNAAVAIGGRGLTEEFRSKLAYTTFGDGISHLTEFAQTLYRRPQRPRRGRPPAS